MNWIILISGLYLILISFISKTENIQSALIFKFIPFLLGVGCILSALNLMNILIFRL